MTRAFRSELRSLGPLAIVGLCTLAGCFADAGYAVTVDGDYVEDPPPAFVVTTAPYYYEGRPTYWYGGHWQYRADGRWQHYRAEPAPLRDFRMHPGPRRAPRVYEHPLQRRR